MSPDLPLQFGAVSLDPTKQRRVIDRDAAVRQRRGEIAVADRRPDTSVTPTGSPRTRNAAP